MAQARDVVKSFDAEPEMKKALTENLNNMMLLAQAKSELFIHDIYDSIRTSGGQENRKVAVSSVIGDTRIVRCYSRKENSSIAGVVNNVVGSFMKGTGAGVLEGICGIITGALDIFLGEGTGETGVMEDYYIASAGQSLVRLDMKAWYLNTTTSALTKSTEMVMASVGVKSIVDLTKIDLNTFSHFYQQQMESANLSAEELKKQINEMREIFELFRPANDAFKSSMRGGGQSKSFQSVQIPPNAYLASRTRSSLKQNGGVATISSTDFKKNIVSELSVISDRLKEINSKL